jgi:acetylornithine deacetylase/succinyl-diaminopimelate desuccinylase-like protein
MRIPPTCNPDRAAAAIQARLEEDPPYGASVTFEPDAAGGWNAPSLAPWLAQSVSRASETFFGKPDMAMGEGGSIPFMAMLGARFPDAQFLITGVLGPASNAHGPNEYLHIPTGKKLTGCVATVLADTYRA